MKRIFVIAAVLLVVNGVFAQVKFGVKAGANLSSVSDLKISSGGTSVQLTENDGMSFGFHAGVFANISLSERFGLQPELLFSRQGGKQKINSDLENMEGFDMGEMGAEGASSTFEYNYINLPILLEFKPIPHLGVLVGPQLGLNVSKSETSGGITLSGSELEDMYKEQWGGNPFQSFDVGLVVGAQYTFVEHFTVGMRYNFGLTNSMDASVTDSQTGMRVETKGLKNNVLQVSVGYLF